MAIDLTKLVRSLPKRVYKGGKPRRVIMLGPVQRLSNLTTGYTKPEPTKPQAVLDLEAWLDNDKT